MKFNCGEDWCTKVQRKRQWHRWFAWYPVRIANYDCRWLEFVERQGDWQYDSDGGSWFFKYRSIK